MSLESHSRITLALWKRLRELSAQSAQEVLVKGQDLTLADVVAVARHGTSIHIDDSEDVVKRVEGSVKLLEQCLEDGQVIYGITTGFGGSANTQTKDTHRLQMALMQMQQCGVLSTTDLGTTSMPESWVRASMLVRCNTVVRGHSGVRFRIIQDLARLLNENCTPFVPLRGSISASGDLSPLSYIAGVLEGNPKLLLWCRRGNEPSELVSADKVLEEVHIEPVSFGPKEALGLINGTAVSAGVGALALHQTHQLAVLAQVLTAMGVEVMAGTSESFDGFIARVRPHVGQGECARNISQFLRGSRLALAHLGVNDGDGDEAEISTTATTTSHSLRQDRYPLRTASQWMGPLLEDLMLAHRQVTVELNATTDNPLIDIEGRRILHGGNFQAMPITAAMEKARSALQLMGKMLFAQCTEIINPDLNNGLPPNLCFDEPSLSYCLKGVDIAMAAYASELGFLAHSVGPNVQSAEMSNQAINSLALVSARYTQTAIDVFSMLATSYIYVLCQGLDLRVLQTKFLDTLRPAVQSITETSFSALCSADSLAELHSSLWEHFTQALKSPTATTKDSSHRFSMVTNAAQSVIVTFFTSQDDTGLPSPQLDSLHAWTKEVTSTMAEIFAQAQTSMLSGRQTSAYLGAAAGRVYNYVRGDLNIPLNRGLVDHPTLRSRTETEANGQMEDTDTIGAYVSKIYEALRSGELMDPVMDCLDQGTQGISYCKTCGPEFVTD